MTHNLPDRVYRELISFAKQYGIERLVLFGSRARGTHAERSDVDLAVRGGDFDGFYWAVKDELHSLLMFDLIDLSESVSEELQEEIQQDGVMLYEKNRSA